MYIYVGLFVFKIKFIVRQVVEVLISLDLKLIFIAVGV